MGCSALLRYNDAGEGDVKELVENEDGEKKFLKFFDAQDHRKPFLPLQERDVFNNRWSIQSDLIEKP
jgi:hypothetical protein